MCDKSSPDDRRDPPRIPPPAVGALVVDTARARLGEFRGEWCGMWSLRPVTGGKEWDADPEHVRPADRIERLSAETARANARSRGELL